jgi:hypothetical protein
MKRDKTQIRKIRNEKRGDNNTHQGNSGTHQQLNINKINNPINK